MFQRQHPCVALLLLAAALFATIPTAHAQSTAGLSTPGTTAYVDPGFRRIGHALNAGAPGQPRLGFYDPVTGSCFAVLGDNPGLSQVVKYSPGIGSTPPGRIGSADLIYSDGVVVSGVIDPTRGFLLLGTDSSPARIVKVSLGAASAAPSRTTTMILPAGESVGGAALIDGSNGFAYFSTSAGLLKIDIGDSDGPLRRLGLGLGMGVAATGALDESSGHGYFATPLGVVHKFHLGLGEALPSHIGSVSLPAAEGNPTHGFFDPSTNCFILGAGTGTKKVVKISGGTGAAAPTRVGSVDLGAATQPLSGLAKYPGDPFAIAVQRGATFAAPRKIYKVALEASGLPPTVSGSVDLTAGSQTNTVCMLPDVREFLVQAGPEAFRFALGDGTGLPTLSAQGDLECRDYLLRYAYLDAPNRHAYFFAEPYGSLFPGTVVKMALGTDSTAPHRLASLTLPPNYLPWAQTALDATRGYLYVSGYDGEHILGKVRLGSGSTAPVLVREQRVLNGLGFIQALAMDAAGGYLYLAFGSGGVSSTIHKFDVGTGDEPLVLVGSCVLPNDEATTQMVVDAAEGRLLIASNQINPEVSYSRLRIVNTGVGASPPTVGGIVEYPRATEFFRVSTAQIDATARMAYFMDYDGAEWHMSKIDLGTDVAPPSYAGAVTIPAQASDMSVWGTAMDPARQETFVPIVAPPDSPGLARVSHGSGASLPTVVDSIAAQLYSGIARCGVVDAVQGVVLLGGWEGSNRIQLVGTDEGQRSFLKGTRFTMPEWGAVTEMRFHSHEAAGNVRLALYDNGSPRRRIWESGVVANTADDADLVVPISAGTPAALSLPAGTYWAAWQVDTRAAVPSYTAGAAGTGFTLTQFFGPMPPDLSNPDIVATNQNWTQYITYTPDDEAPASALLAQGATQVGGAMTGTYSASDTGGSGVATVRLFVKPPGGSWMDAGAVTGGAWSHSPAATGDAADGAYEFATVATDVAGNAEGAPTSADAVVLYNDAENSNYSVTYAGDGSAVFPMTASLNVGIEITGATPPVTVTVSRATGDATPGAPFNAARLIDERLSITGALNGGTATLTWPIDPASDDGLVTPFDTVFRFESGSFADAHPVAAGVSPIVVTGITGFSEWWAGTSDARVGEWSLYGE